VVPGRHIRRSRTTSGDHARLGRDQEARMALFVPIDPDFFLNTT
jgi:hypothetical protein